MGKAGPQRMSQEQLQHIGSSLKDRKDEPLEYPVEPLENALLKPDPVLNEDEVIIWKWITPHLLEMGFFTVTDVPNVVLYCQDWVKLQEFKAELESVGDHVDVCTNGAENTYKKENPYFKITSELTRRIKTFNDDYGLSPKARLKVPSLQRKKLEKDASKKSRFFKSIKDRKNGTA